MLVLAGNYWFHLEVPNKRFNQISHIHCSPYFEQMWNMVNRYNQNTHTDASDHLCITFLRQQCAWLYQTNRPDALKSSWHFFCPAKSELQGIASDHQSLCSISDVTVQINGFIGKCNSTVECLLYTTYMFYVTFNYIALRQSLWSCGTWPSTLTHSVTDLVSVLRDCRFFLCLTSS